MHKLQDPTQTQKNYNYNDDEYTHEYANSLFTQEKLGPTFPLVCIQLGRQLINTECMSSTNRWPLQQLQRRMRR
jgi:hypothetical protein